MNFPKYNKSSKKGEDGITILKKIVENELGWIFRVNHKEHDFGIDAYFDIVLDSDITGKTIAVQVKTGKSYFKEKNDFGWVYKGKMSHLNYYLNHQIPVIIIIIDDAEQCAFWCLCDFSKTESSGDNWKITIPFGKQLTKESKSELLKYVSPVRDYASQLENFWELNNKLNNTDKIVLNIDREYIENNSSKELIQGIERLKVNDEIISKSKEKVIICIDGYNLDERELYAIPEFKVWLKNVYPKINGLVYFLDKDLGSGFIKLIFFSTMKIEYTDIVVSGIPMRKHIYQPEVIYSIIEELVEDLSKFCYEHKIPKDVYDEVNNNLKECITKIVPPPAHCNED